MITITIEETDKDGQLLGRHVASAPIDKNDTKGIGSLLAGASGGMMYHTEARAEIPLLIAAAGTTGRVRPRGHRPRGGAWPPGRTASTW